jgi:hypothetical protein
MHISGHLDKSVNASTGAFVLCNLIILVLSTFYVVWRVYSKKKFLTESFKREHGLRGHANDIDNNSDVN